MVVTGGAGFIGANLVARLGRRHSEWELVALDDLSSGFRSNLDACPRARLVEGSILDENALGNALHGADAIVHLAARPSVPRSIAAPAVPT